MLVMAFHALQAHVESVALGAFQAAVEACIDPDCRRALKALCDLFALRCIEKDTMFRNDEYVAPAKVRPHVEMLLPSI
jgi:acyl-CoA oxidase